MDMVASNSISLDLDPQKLPPTERAAFYHSLRVYLQIMLWKRLLNEHDDLDPQQWGWRLDRDVLRPIMSDLDAAPDSLLKFVRCKCKLTSKPLWNQHMFLSKKWFEVCNNVWGLPRRKL